MIKQYRIWMLGAVLLVSASTAAALSLGRARGAVLLGRGLDLSIQTTLEAQEPLPEASCFAVDVFYGDTRISPSSVSLTPERLPGGESRLRIRSSVTVDEPVVTVYVRAACGASVSRRYVLLADALTEAESPSPNAPAPAPAQVPRIALPIPANQANSATAGASTSQAPSRALNPEAAAQVQARAQLRAQQRQERRERLAEQRQARREQAQSAPTAAAKPRASIMQGSGPRKTAGPRLQVDLLDLASVAPSLRSSNELASAPSSDANVRSQAQALWRALNASPEDALRDAQRLQSLEIQMRTSLEQSKRQGQDITSLNTQLQAAEKARYLNPLMAAMALLTLFALGLSFWFWRKSAGAPSGVGVGQPWYRRKAEHQPQDEAHLWSHLNDAQPSKSAPLAGKSVDIPLSEPISTQVGKAAVKAEGKSPSRFAERASNTVEFSPPSSPIGLSTAKIQPLGSQAGYSRGGSMGRVDNTPPPSFIPAVKSDSVSKGPRSGFGNADFAQSGFAPSRMAAAEELFDIQEQADFFMSLDQPDQAVEVLKNHITDSVETSALAYMDLFDIYHRTNAEKDYNALREEFNRVFNAQVPNFASYTSKTRGLEDYPVALKNIQEHWPSRQAMHVIEESIFRQPDSQMQPFDMLAYRELMLLYSLTKEIDKMGGDFAPVMAISSVGALSASAVMQLDDVPDSGQVDLGIDLSNTDNAAVRTAIRSDSTVRFPASRPEIDALDFDISDFGDAGQDEQPLIKPVIKPSGKK